MLFDANIQVADINCEPMEDHVQVVLHLAFSMPTGNGVIPFPAGILRFGMTKDGATKKFKEALEVVETIEDTPKSDLVVASSLAGVEDALKLNDNLKAGK